MNNLSCNLVYSISRLSAVNVVINTPLFVRVLTPNQSEIDSFGSVASQVGLFSRRTCSYDSHSMVKQTFPKCVYKSQKFLKHGGHGASAEKITLICFTSSIFFRLSKSPGHAAFLRSHLFLLKGKMSVTIHANKLRELRRDKSQKCSICPVIGVCADA